MTAQYSPAIQYENQMFEQYKQMELNDNWTKMMASGAAGFP